ncbi:MAG TPA: S41 family peptidase, partial [Flavisolibacter sp.]|nr:S41 family peptidase [Flavisolibacter sp.]
MRAALPILLFFLLPAAASSQTCDCTAEFQYIKHYFEENHPGFQLKIKNNPQRLNHYRAAVAKIEGRIKKLGPEDLCIFLLEDYLELLQDHHISIDPRLETLPVVNERVEDEKTALFASATYKGHETVRLDSSVLVAELEKKAPASLEGLYTDGAGNRIGVIRNHTGKRDYVGILLSSKSTLWKYGQVKLELRQVRENVYDVTYYTRSFGKVGKRTLFTDGGIPYFGVRKTGVPKTGAANASYEFRSIDTNTNYLRLGSFNADLYSELDSFYRTIDKDIRRKPFLLIDIRDNGGGSEQCYFPLLAYAYTRPYAPDTLEWWATDNNIRLYETYVGMMKKDSAKYGSGTVGKYEQMIGRMKAAKKPAFIFMANEMPVPIKFDSVLAYPRKIILLQNRHTASAAEGFIFMVRQSGKVITAGENSGGFVGFGNV